MNFETKDESTLPPECLACELMLTDALDETLTEVDQRWFDAHVGSCPACHEMLTDAKRGAAWLDMLKLTPPEPSAALFERILAQTTGAAAAQDLLVPTGLIEPAFAPAVPLTATPPRPRASAGATLLSFPYIPRPSRMFFEPRLIMTAAMAFFSIALTLNLTGVRLGELHASDLNPDNLRHSFFEARASAVRTYDSMRVVHVLESRVDDLRDVTSPETAPAEAPAQQQPAAPSAAPSHAPAAPEGPNSPEDKQPQPQEKRGVSERRAPEPIRPRAARSSTMLAEVQAADASRTWPATEGGL